MVIVWLLYGYCVVRQGFRQVANQNVINRIRINQFDIALPEFLHLVWCVLKELFGTLCRDSTHHHFYCYLASI